MIIKRLESGKYGWTYWAMWEPFKGETLAIDVYLSSMKC
jgi:hypothetical protein